MASSTVSLYAGCLESGGDQSPTGNPT